MKDSNLSTGVHFCPQDGSVRVFQRVSALEKHLSVEKRSRSPEKYFLMDLAKIRYKTHLEECVAILPSLKAPVGHQEGYFVPNEGWALRAAKKAYRFSEKQKSYLQVASPQTSCGVCSSRIHFSPTWGRNECVTNKPHRTFAGRLTY